MTRFIRISRTQNKEFSKTIVIFIRLIFWLHSYIFFYFETRNNNNLKLKKLNITDLKKNKQIILILFHIIINIL